ncbi:hypothetical protein PFISCL1PPCAC_5061 [Pristionchus fissidentatus]|uniref:Major sperm protein n=1 Tax=Pristionchus fissidentatus TaxID=1538716 RepID=A0AAV5V783_9BILA|nr:hypothetical protein PFISCL1PPCAC_5061 [Pristionchus fissidentatus]
MAATNPEKIIFNHSDTPTTRRVLIRNPTNSVFILKIVPTNSAVVSVDARNIMIKPKNFVPINITVNTMKIPLFEYASHSVNVYARPYSTANHKCIQEWISTDGSENLKQRVQSLVIKVSKDYSARDTVLDLPGAAQSIESTVWAQTSRPDCPLDKDTLTAVRFDADCLTAQAIDPADTKFTPTGTTCGAIAGWAVATAADWLQLPTAIAV